MTSRLVNNTYIWQNYEQYVRPLFKEIKNDEMHIKEQAPLLNSSFRQTLIFLLFPKCANGSVYSGLCEAVRTALKWSVLVEIDRHPIQSSLFNTETKGTEPSVRFTEVSEKVWFLAFLGPNELSVIERCAYYRGVRKERLHQPIFWGKSPGDEVEVTLYQFFSVTRKAICQWLKVTNSYKLKKYTIGTWDQTCSKHKKLKGSC